MLATGIRSVVLCNTMIYGNALGASAQSVQIPALVRQAKASGVARYIGRGLNRWSNVHIADVAALYTLAIAKAPAGKGGALGRRPFAWFISLGGQTEPVKPVCKSQQSGN